MQMSPHVNNFVTDLVLMAKAMEELPQVREELEHTKRELDKAHSTIQDRELSIIALKIDVDQHLASIRNLEVARDDAEMRFLELDDKTNTVEQLADSAAAMLDKIKSLIAPPKPEPIAPSTIQDQPVGQDQSADPLPEASWAGETKTTTSQQDSMAHDVMPPGQSEADPTAVGQATSEQGSSQTNATSEPVGSAEYAASTSGKYSNKLYEDHPYYVSLPAWLAGGGTEADYNFRKPVAEKPYQSF